MADLKTNTYANDADARREKLAGTVDELQDRLTPRRVIEDTVEAAQDRAADLARGANEHKLAIGLIGASVGLILLARKAANAPRTAGANAVQRGIDAARDATSSVTESASEAWQSARERATELTERAKLKAAEASQLANENFNTSPLAGALLGLAAGAIAGALAPRTGTEDSLIGEHRDRFTDAARDAIRAAVDAGREQLESYGLNAESAREKFDTLKVHARDVAQTIGKAAVDSVRTGRSN